MSKILTYHFFLPLPSLFLSPLAFSHRWSRRWSHHRTHRRRLFHSSIFRFRLLFQYRKSRFSQPANALTPFITARPLPSPPSR